MNMIWRNSISCLRLGKVPHRYQSGYHPVAPLGSRILTDPAKVFEHNMWDHMQWSKEEEAAARKKVKENSAVRVLLEEQVKYEREASKYWDTFYKIHKNKFFKDRNWLLREFPEILPVDQKPEEKARESSWDHVKTSATNCFSRMHCPTVPEEKNHYEESSGSSEGQSKTESDFSNLDSEKHKKGPMKTGLYPGSNATFRILEVGCGAGNSVFPILNTLHHTRPTEQPSVLPLFMMYVMMAYLTLFQMGSWMSFSLSLCSLLFILTGHCLSENFYVRGDGTRAYFFTKGELHSMFCKASLDEKQNLVDRRLQVNRKKQVKMHRVWIQGKFQKPLHQTQNSSNMVSTLLSQD
ncbi:tRNA N(3)-methylcytidine methyltransferase METTL8, mitochondrial isoform X3 [Symphalangus syndactylus]|uniref:tRNA N(3)-methylcytidine methyltransferase METTL8, mitochondrial isoform X3 n=1 Tax=Symphalangus syndactylus TaxID=9590 RepID=UPI002442DFA5|nr:tRNA N(3)-methylcytidine methyltransferase METTL8, mitochondrial isoform X3 [Symphalangus syndactylus]